MLITEIIAVCYDKCIKYINTLPEQNGGGFHLKAGGAYNKLWCEALNLLSAAKYSI
jgi:hypothetical protein